MNKNKKARRPLTEDDLRLLHALGIIRLLAIERPPPVVLTLVDSPSTPQ